MRSTQEIRAWWRDQPRVDQLALLALAVVLLVRATHASPHSDRVGFVRMGQAFLAGDFLRDPTINTYPPFFSLLCVVPAAVTAALGDRACGVLWGAGQVLALVGWASRVVPLFVERVRARHVWVVGVLCLRPIVGDLGNQNVSIWLWSMVFAAVGAAGARPARAGWLLGLGTALKVMPSFAAGPVVGRASSRARVVAAGLVAPVVLTLALVLAHGGPATAEMFRFWLGEVVAKAGGDPLLNQSLRAQLWRWCGEPVLGAGLGLGLWAMWTVNVLWRPSRDLPGALVDAAVAVALGQLMLPFAWFHYFLVLFPVVCAVAFERHPLRLGLLGAGFVLLGLLDRDLVGLRLWAMAAAQGASLWGALLWTLAGISWREARRGAPSALVPRAPYPVNSFGVIGPPPRPAADPITPKEFTGG